ncbi:pilus assembly protein TadG-related protein [Nocardiopsis coralliicola]
MSAFVLVITLALIAMFALVLEGGTALSERARALRLAQEAARAGAQHIDLAAYRTGEDIVLDEHAAEQAAQRFLADAGAEGQARVEGGQVAVTARLEVAFVLLPLGPRTVAATAAAAPHTP